MSHKQQSEEQTLTFSQARASNNNATAFNQSFTAGLMKSTMDRVRRPVLLSPFSKTVSSPVHVPLRRLTGTQPSLYQTFLQQSFSPVSLTKKETDTPNKSLVAHHCAESSGNVSCADTLKMTSEVVPPSVKLHQTTCVLRETTYHQKEGDTTDSSVDPVTIHVTLDNFTASDEKENVFSSHKSTSCHYQTIAPATSAVCLDHLSSIDAPKKNSKPVPNGLEIQEENDFKADHHTDDLKDSESGDLEYSASAHDAFMLVKGTPFLQGDTSCNSSPCSTRSLSVDVRSRCSSGDGCSSVDCSCTHQTVLSVSPQSVDETFTRKLQSSLQNYTFGNEDDGSNFNLRASRFTEEQDSESSEQRVERMCVTTNQEMKTCKKRNHPPSHCREQENKWQSASPIRGKWKSSEKVPERTSTSDQVVNLLLRVQFSWYRQLMEEYSRDKQMYQAMNDKLKSQRTLLACLIQTIVILSSRVKLQDDTVASLKILIHEQKASTIQSRRQQRLVSCLLVLTIFLSLLNIEGVRLQLCHWLQMFHLGKRWQSVQRFQRMVSENWRNVPSLLTNFWRIFIFDARSRLHLQS